MRGCGPRRRLLERDASWPLPALARLRRSWPADIRRAGVPRLFAQRTRATQARSVFSSFRAVELSSVVVRRIAVDGVYVIGGFVVLRRVLNDHVRTLNAVVRGDVAAGRSVGRPAPCKPGLVEFCLELRHS